MAKLNPKNSLDGRFDKEKTLPNGAFAAKQSNYDVLRRLVLACMLWEDNAYVDGVKTAEQIADLIPKCDAKQVADLVVETRQNQKLRHIPLFMIVEMLKYADHKKYVANIIPQVCTRVDMMTDLLALYWSENANKPIPAQLKKGLAKAFVKFDEYNFAKYNRDNVVKLRDVMFLCHPKPVDEAQAEVFKRIASNTLQTPDTWEVALSSGANKKDTWTRLVKEGKLGGLAMLRNIRNMKDSGVDKSVIVYGLNTIKSAMLLPLDFMKTNTVNPEFSREIEDVMLRSYENLPKLTGRTLIIVDVSGSMGSNISGKSDFTRKDAAKAMAMLAVSTCESYEIVCTAGSDSKGEGAHEHIKYPMKGFGLFNQIDNTNSRIGGGGIFTRQCLEWCKKNIEGDFDRIIVFSDSQDCDKINPIAKPYGKNNYIIDVSSHKRGINYKGVWTGEISGWSEKFLNFIAASEGIENQFED